MPASPPHLRLQEPELEADEEDGEGDRESWGSSREEEEEEEDGLSEGSSVDDLLEAMLAAKTGGGE